MFQLAKKFFRGAYAGGMRSILIIEAECLDEGVLVTFDDGITALFPASFMSSHLAEAVEITQYPPELMFA